MSSTCPESRATTPKWRVRGSALVEQQDPRSHLIPEPHQTHAVLYSTKEHSVAMSRISSIVRALLLRRSSVQTR